MVASRGLPKNYLVDPSADLLPVARANYVSKQSKHTPESIPMFDNLRRSLLCDIAYTKPVDKQSNHYKCDRIHIIAWASLGISPRKEALQSVFTNRLQTLYSLYSTGWHPCWTRLYLGPIPGSHTATQVTHLRR